MPMTRWAGAVREILLGKDASAFTANASHAYQARPLKKIPGHGATYSPEEKENGHVTYVTRSLVFKK